MMAVLIKIDLALSLERGVVAKPNAKGAPYNGFAESESQVLIANTQGTQCYQSLTQPIATHTRYMSVMISNLCMEQCL